MDMTKKIGAKPIGMPRILKNARKQPVFLKPAARPIPNPAIASAFLTFTRGLN